MLNSVTQITAHSWLTEGQETCINLALGLGQVSTQPYGANILESVLKITMTMYHQGGT